MGLHDAGDGAVRAADRVDARIRLEGAKPARMCDRQGRPAALALPAVLFVVLLVFQIAPLPPSLMRVISPATYRLYATSFPGWPRDRAV